MIRIVAALAAAAAVLAAAPVAAADPEPAPPAPGLGSGWAQCGDRLIPADPRLDVQNPLGGLIYREMLQRMCAADPGPQPAP